MSGPGAPVSKALLWCGWRVLPIDILLDPTHDLSDVTRQRLLHEQLQDADCIMAALDCSTKSRAREIPLHFSDGRPSPKPLRSNEHPEGLPDLHPRDKARVLRDNKAAGFVLEEIQAMVQRGGATVRENPGRSLHSELPEEKKMMDSGQYWETEYSACVFQSARCKYQKLRHNVLEINQWPKALCAHTHAGDEWKPWTEHGRRVYPSKEEAEYSAGLAFALAVALSWWAARVGRAVLHVPRMPPMETVGRREHWLELHPQSLRSWAMAPLAILLGLEPPNPQERARIPSRGRVQDLLHDGRLPAGAIYVGQGHHSHRLPTTCWKSPFVAGHDCAPDEVMPLYIDHIKRNFEQELHSLLGKTLVCDCAEGELCEADVLAGLVFEATSPNASAPHPRAAGVPPRRVVRGPKRGQQALAALQAPTLAGSSVVRWTQEAVVTTFKKLFPADWFSQFKFPMIEDLLNQHPFCSYVQWREEQGLEWDGPLNPAGGSGFTRLRQRHSEGKQAGSLSHRAALPPLLPFGLDPDEHFEAACTVGQYPLPTERPPVIDSDLQFAAYMHAQAKNSLDAWRERALGMLRELKRRWASVSDRLRAIQTDAIAQVTAKRDLGLTALLVVLTQWGDTCYPYGLVTGLPAVGTAPCYNIFPAQQGCIINLADVVEDTDEHNRAIIAKLRPGIHDDFLLSQSLVDRCRQGLWNATHDLGRALASHQRTSFSAYP